MKTEVKERPITFNAPMVKALLVGSKTVTRRPLKPQPIDVIENKPIESNGVRSWCALTDKNPGRGKMIRCRLGEVGDRLWVRESFYIDDYRYESGPLPKRAPRLEDGMLIYSADGTCCEQFGECQCGGKGCPWRPASRMPKWASRITLEITSVRVERLHAIGKDGRKAEQVKAEGIEDVAIAREREWFHPDDAPAIAFKRLWDSIYAKKRLGWEANPYVWRIEFKRINP